MADKNSALIQGKEWAILDLVSHLDQMLIVLTTRSAFRKLLHRTDLEHPNALRASTLGTSVQVPELIISPAELDLKAREGHLQQD